MPHGGQKNLFKYPTVKLRKEVQVEVTVVKGFYQNPSIQNILSGKRQHNKAFNCFESNIF